MYIQTFVVNKKNYDYMLFHSYLHLHLHFMYIVFTFVMMALQFSTFKNMWF